MNYGLHKPDVQLRSIVSSFIPSVSAYVFFDLPLAGHTETAVKNSAALSGKLESGQL